MAILYRCDGTTEQLAPANGVHWSLEELQGIVGGGYIDVVRTRGRHWMVIDDEAKLKRKPPNRAATALYLWGDEDMIAGDALVVENFLELDGPPDPKEEA